MATHYGNNTVTGIISDVRVGLSRFVFDRPLLARLVYSPSGGIRMNGVLRRTPMMIIIRLIISTYFTQVVNGPRGPVGQSLSAPHFVDSFVRPFSLSSTYISGFPPIPRFKLLQEIPLNLITRT